MPLISYCEKYFEVIIDSTQIECKRQGELHVTVDIQVLAVQNEAICNVCGAITIMYLEKNVVLEVHSARFCAKTL